MAWDVESTTPPQVDAGEKITPELLPFESAKRLVMGQSNMAEAELLFKNLESTSGLLALPEFKGREIVT